MEDHSQIEKLGKGDFFFFFPKKKSQRLDLWRLGGSQSLWKKQHAGEQEAGKGQAQPQKYFSPTAGAHIHIL